jgi:hypothetical protein
MATLADGTFSGTQRIPLSQLTGASHSAGLWQQETLSSASRFLAYEWKEEGD